ncbi:MAG: hypothetical protein Tsb0020_45510 [Haliangiales bacterium]
MVASAALCALALGGGCEEVQAPSFRLALSGPLQQSQAACGAGAEEAVSIEQVRMTCQAMLRVKFGSRTHCVAVTPGAEDPWDLSALGGIDMDIPLPLGSVSIAMDLYTPKDPDTVFTGPDCPVLTEWIHVLSSGQHEFDSGATEVVDVPFTCRPAVAQLWRPECGIEVDLNPLDLASDSPQLPDCDPSDTEPCDVGEPADRGGSSNILVYAHEVVWDRDDERWKLGAPYSLLENEATNTWRLAGQSAEKLTRGGTLDAPVCFEVLYLDPDDVEPQISCFSADQVRGSAKQLEVAYVSPETLTCLGDVGAVSRSERLDQHGVVLGRVIKQTSNDSGYFEGASNVTVIPDDPEGEREPESLTMTGLRADYQVSARAAEDVQPIEYIELNDEGQCSLAATTATTDSGYFRSVVPFPSEFDVSSDTDAFGPLVERPIGGGIPGYVNVVPIELIATQTETE